MPKPLTIESAKQVIRRLSNERDYWRRRVLNPNYDAARKARQRLQNPAMYRRELRKNRDWNRKRTALHRAIILWAIAFQIGLSKSASRATTGATRISS